MKIDLNSTRIKFCEISNYLIDVADTYKLSEDWHDRIYESYRKFNDETRKMGNDFLAIAAQLKNVEAGVESITDSSSVASKIERLYSE